MAWVKKSQSAAVYIPNCRWNREQCVIPFKTYFLALPYIQPLNWWYLCCDWKSWMHHASALFKETWTQRWWLNLLWKDSLSASPLLLAAKEKSGSRHSGLYGCSFLCCFTGNEVFTLKKFLKVILHTHLGFQKCKFILWSIYFILSHGFI